MSQVLEELVQLLSAPDFWESEGIIALDRIVPQLNDQEAAEFFHMGQDRSPEWQEKFRCAWSLVAVPPRVVRRILDLLNADDPALSSEGFDWFMSSGIPATQINEPELNSLARLWRAHPEWRERIQMTLWRMGKSGQLRRLLGFERWSDSKASESV